MYVYVFLTIRFSSAYNINNCFCNLAHHLSHKQQSPGSQNGRASNLRVAIPTALAQNMTTADELGYVDVSDKLINGKTMFERIC